MASPGQKRGACGHLMAVFDQHTCARCRDKGQGMDFCMLKEERRYCELLTSEQKLQLSTPAFKLKKEQEI